MKSALTDSMGSGIDLICSAASSKVMIDHIVSRTCTVCEIKLFLGVSQGHMPVSTTMVHRVINGKTVYRKDALGHSG